MECVIQSTELSSHGTRCEFNGGRCTIKLEIDVHQDFYVVVMQEGASNPKPPQRFAKQAFVHWAAKLRSRAEFSEAERTVPATSWPSILLESSSHAGFSLFGSFCILDS